MTKRKTKEHNNCLQCNTLLKGKSQQKFCCIKCGYIWRKNNIYKYKYSYAHRNKSPYNFMRSLLSKKYGERKEISPEFLQKLYEKQNGLCAISGIEMSYVAGQGRIGTNISIDRIDPDKGYTQDNIQLVTCDVNRIKGVLSMNELYELCTNIIKNKKV